MVAFIALQTWCASGNMISCSHKYMSTAHAHRNTLTARRAYYGWGTVSGLEFGVLELGAWSLEFLYGRGRLIPHAQKHEVE